MNIGVQIDAETMARVEAMLAQVPKGAERAFSNAINRGLSKVKTGAFREVKRVYTVQSSALSSATSTNIKKASTGDLAGHVHFAGYETPVQVQRNAEKARNRKAGKRNHEARRRGRL